MTTLNEIKTKIINKIEAVNEGESKITIAPRALEQMKEVFAKIEKEFGYKEEEIDIFTLDIIADIFSKAFISGDIRDGVMHPATEELHQQEMEQLSFTGHMQTHESVFIMKAMIEALDEKGYFYK